MAGVSIDEDPYDVLPKVIERFQIRYPILAYRAVNPDTSVVEAIPKTIVLDRAGRVARIIDGLVNDRWLEKDIDELLAER